MWEEFLVILIGASAKALTTEQTIVNKCSTYFLFSEGSFRNECDNAPPQYNKRYAGFSANITVQIGCGDWPRKVTFKDFIYKLPC